MTTNIFQFSFWVFMISALNTAYTQPHTAQWPFYLAFEDATGARDTLWFLIDQDATLPNYLTPPYSDGNDAQFGEIPIPPNDTSFHVYFEGIESIDSAGSITFGKFNVGAYPVIGSIWHSINAENYTLPIVVRWDSFLLWYGLYTLGVWPIYCSMANDYLWWNDLHWSTDAGSFDLLNSFNTTALELPEIGAGPTVHFLFDFYLYLETIPPLFIRENHKNKLKAHPNPVINEVLIESDEPIVSITILNLLGHEVLKHFSNDNKNLSRLDLSTLPKGMYVARVHGLSTFSLIKLLKN